MDIERFVEELWQRGLPVRARARLLLLTTNHHAGGVIPARPERKERNMAVPASKRARAMGEYVRQARIVLAEMDWRLARGRRRHEPPVWPYSGPFGYMRLAPVRKR